MECFSHFFKGVAKNTSFFIIFNKRQNKSLWQNNMYSRRNH